VKVGPRTSTASGMRETVCTVRHGWEEGRREGEEKGTEGRSRERGRRGRDGERGMNGEGERN
jgi:hypothetical protein